MPRCGSQIVLCDLPIRFDMYRGCGHGCTYCFSRNKRDLADIVPDESPAQLKRFIDGHRTAETRWCDWRIPLHFGGVSDPLQPCERHERRTLACLELLAESRYPFVLSTKSTLAVASPWREALAHCNVVVQVSMVAPAFDKLEPGAPPFAERLKMLPTLARLVPRVVVRVQPYTPDVLADVLRVLPRYARAGVHGITVEGLKRRRMAAGLVRIGPDWLYPTDVLEPDFQRIRERCHGLGLRFYCAENRLRRLSDDRCCCGVDGLPGFRPNRANLNSLALGRPLSYRRAMRRRGSAAPFKSLTQSPAGSCALPRLSYRDCMELVARVPGYRVAVGLPQESKPRRRPRSLTRRTRGRETQAHGAGPSVRRCRPERRSTASRAGFEHPSNPRAYRTVPVRHCAGSTPGVTASGVYQQAARRNRSRPSRMPICHASKRDSAKPIPAPCFARKPCMARPLRCNPHTRCAVTLDRPFSRATGLGASANAVLRCHAPPRMRTFRSRATSTAQHSTCAPRPVSRDNVAACR